MKTRTDILHLIEKNTIGAEIGVFEGEFSIQINNIVTPKTLHLVDLFEGQMCSGDKDGNNIKYINLDSSYKNLLNKFANNSSINIFKGTSYSFYKTIPDNYLDFIYIDGDHTYNGVCLDLEHSRNKVKSGGVISGHDYTPTFEGVIRAVDEFCSRYNLSKVITLEDGCPSYYIINL